MSTVPGVSDAIGLRERSGVKQGVRRSAKVGLCGVMVSTTWLLSAAENFAGERLRGDLVFLMSVFSVSFSIVLLLVRLAGEIDFFSLW